MTLLLDLRDRLGTTMMIATHDSGNAGRCDRTIHIRDGKISKEL